VGLFVGIENDVGAPMSSRPLVEGEKFYYSTEQILARGQHFCEPCALRLCSGQATARSTRPSNKKLPARFSGRHPPSMISTLLQRRHPERGRRGDRVEGPASYSSRMRWRVPHPAFFWPGGSFDLRTILRNRELFKCLMLQPAATLTPRAGSARGVGKGGYLSPARSPAKRSGVLGTLVQTV
jgi:hypothetical protein